MGWTTGESMFNPQEPWDISSFFVLSGLKLGSTQHSIEWGTRAIRLGVKPPRSESNFSMAPK